MTMTLDEAINHALDKAKDFHCDKGYRENYAQLAHWLKELKVFKAKQPSKQYSWIDTHLNYDVILKSQKVKSGKFPIAFQYIDNNGIRHTKTGWYSNRSNYIDDFKSDCSKGNS